MADQHITTTRAAAVRGYRAGMPIRAIVFDLFDTLVDLSMSGLPQVDVGGRRFPSTAGELHSVASRHSEIGLVEFVDVLREVDLGFRQTRYAQGLELPTLERMEAVAARLGVDGSALPQELVATHMGLLRGQVSLPAHHGEVLSALARRASLALCSNLSHSETALGLLEEYDLARHLDVLVISDAIGIRKPRPEIFEAVLERLGTRPEETLHVGDSLKADIAGAAHVGLRTAWITRRVRDIDEALAAHDGVPPDHVIGDLAELEAVLEG